jgi:hypothetical protein
MGTWAPNLLMRDTVDLVGAQATLPFQKNASDCRRPVQRRLASADFLSVKRWQASPKSITESITLGLVLCF